MVDLGPPCARCGHRVEWHLDLGDEARLGDRHPCYGVDARGREVRCFDFATPGLRAAGALVPDDL